MEQDCVNVEAIESELLAVHSQRCIYEVQSITNYLYTLKDVSMKYRVSRIICTLSKMYICKASRLNFTVLSRVSASLKSNWKQALCKLQS